MEVIVVGCVNRPGRVKVRKYSRLRTAIVAAGGFRHEKFLFPSGQITIRAQLKGKSKIRRMLGNSDYVRKRVNFKNSKSCLYAERIHSGEHIIVQFGGLGLTWWYNRN